ncbi:MAG: site-specific integrase [Dysosmobacter sp.]
MQVLNREELQRLLIQAKAEGCYELFLLGLSTGLRRGELLALRWEDLNEETGELRVERQVTRTNGHLAVSTPKTKASVRTLVLPMPVVEALREYRASVRSRWMFPSPKNEDAPRDPASCRESWRPFWSGPGAAASGFTISGTPSPRRPWSTAWTSRPSRAVIGHVSAATTLDIYTHVTDRMRAQAAEKIDRRMGGKARRPAPEEADPKDHNTTDFRARPGTRRAGRGPAASPRSTTIFGRWGIPPTGPTGKSTPATSTPTPRRSARKSWRP